MGVITQKHEFFSTIPPSILFKAMIFDFENVITKILPNIIKNVENIKGDGSKPGDIQRLIFFQEDRPDNVKLIDKVDEDNLVYAYTLLEGDFQLNLSEKIEKVSYEYVLEASPVNGGSIIKNTVKYHMSGDHDDQIEIEKERFDAVKDKAYGLFSLIESYLIKQHPHSYN